MEIQENFYLDLLEVTIVLLVTALLSYFIGYLRSSKQPIETKVNTNANSSEKIHKELLDGMGRIEKLLKQTTIKESSKKQVSIGKGTLVDDIPTISTSAAKSAKDVFGKTFLVNDLKIVEGIGPKIEELLNKDGIVTWKQLSQAPVSRLLAILKNGGDQFLLHKPDSWPEQAQLAAEEKWQQLKELQNKYQHN